MATHARILTHLFTKYPGKTGSASQATTRRPNIRSRHYSDVAQQPGTLDSSDNVSVDVPGVCTSAASASQANNLLYHRCSTAGCSSIRCFLSG